MSQPILQKDRPRNRQISTEETKDFDHVNNLLTPKWLSSDTNSSYSPLTHYYI